MGQLRQLAGQTVIYGISSILVRVLNYLLVPLYTRVFDPGEYGIVTELYAYVAFLNVVYTFGFETAYFRFVTKSESHPEKYFNLAQTTLTITAVVFSLTLVLLAEPLSSLLNYSGKGHYIVWLAIIMGMDALVAVPFARLRHQNKPITFAAFRLLSIGVNIGLNLFFLVFCPWWLKIQSEGVISNFLYHVYDPRIGVGYVFLSNLVANALYLVLFFKDLIKVKLRLDSDWVPMFLYAMPLMVMGLAGVTNEMLSRAMLKYLLPEGFYPGRSSQEALGIFGACYKLSVFMTLAVQAFRYAFEPFFFSRSADKSSPALFSRVMHYFIIFGSFSWLIISIGLPDIAPLFLRRPSYLEALEVVPFLLGGGLFLGIYYNLSIWYKLTDKTKYGAYVSILGAFFTILANILIIPLLGYLGSAVVTFATYLLMSVISYHLGQKHYYIPYKTRKGLIYIVMSGVLIIAFYFWGINLEIRYLLAGVSVLIYGIAAWFLDFKEAFRQKE